MKELGQLKHFLGLEIDYTHEGLVLHQKRYSKDLLKKFGMVNCKPISTLMEANAKVCALEGKDLEDATMYRQLVGNLIYLTLSRPDISHAIGVMSRYMQNPKKLPFRLCLFPGIHFLGNHFPNFPVFVCH
jgi:hypothetical protein